MARSVTVRVSGLRELDAALGELPKATARGVMVRVLKKIAQPIADQAESLAHYDTGALKRSAGVGTKLTRRQSRLHKANNKKDFAEVFVGFGGLTQAVTEEFGTSEVRANPAMRPAWDSHKGQIVGRISTEMWPEIKKTVERMAKRRAAKAAKLAAGG